MKNYVSSHMVPYEKPVRTGFSVVPVLQFLWGHPWDQLALNYVHALLPNSIRVVTGLQTTDAGDRRVTVHAKEIHGVLIIKDIEIECQVGLDGDGQELICPLDKQVRQDYSCGHHLRLESHKRGIDIK